ncbi:hypothetical protein [Olivibacter jilunii]|uniref:hypothetical protein n=1 Tax=Olivibacter jilunii TaxID=985016 RepID=UPI00102FBDE5|nr:hypothetical protein [Olivibacter jilunii]
MKNKGYLNTEKDFKRWQATRKRIKPASLRRYTDLTDDMEAMEEQIKYVLLYDAETMIFEMKSERFPVRFYAPKYRPLANNELEVVERNLFEWLIYENVFTDYFNSDWYKARQLKKGGNKRKAAKRRKKDKGGI